MTIFRWAILMLIVSLVAALLGFTDLSAASADVARVLFYVFGVIFLVLVGPGFHDLPVGKQVIRGFS